MHYALRDFMHKSLLPESGSPSCYALGAGMHYQLMHYKQVYCRSMIYAGIACPQLQPQAFISPVSRMPHD